MKKARQRMSGLRQADQKLSFEIFSEHASRKAANVFQ